MRVLALLFALVLAACGDDRQATAPPPPSPLTAEAIGHYCGMAVVEHPGPKGQIHLTGRPEPIWFSSARDTLAFTMLPEEPKDISAIYVTAMDRASEWDNPGEGAWVEARGASFVIGSDAKGGMGQQEIVPFSTPEAAQTFTAEHGGQIASFEQVPRDAVLGSSHKGH